MHTQNNIVTDKLDVESYILTNFYIRRHSVLNVSSLRPFYIET